LAMNMSNTLGYLRGELGRQQPKRTGAARSVLEFGPIKKILLAIYNKIFKLYYE